MKAGFFDIAFHANEMRSLDQLRTFEDHTHETGDVVTACCQADQPRPASISNNPEPVNSCDVLVQIYKNEGGPAT
jgi:hypothetical protein